MKPIIYPPALKKGATVGITAPSSGISAELQSRVDVCIKQLTVRGFNAEMGKCLKSSGIVSADVKSRAAELTSMLESSTVEAIVPPWGGELLIEILAHLNFSKLAALAPKWIVGYSDLSTFLMPYTMLTGIATLHGSNFMESGYNASPTHKHWLDTVTFSTGDVFTQTPAARYQVDFTRFEKEPEVTEWNLKETVKWKFLNHELDTDASVNVSGRLIGGCLETIGMLPGTAYGDIASFANIYAPEGLLLYLEVCEINAPAACRLYHHLKLAGWLDNVNGILIGRTQAPNLGDFTQLDAIKSAFGSLDIPVIYDMDIGHVPPQLMLVNGALATLRFGPKDVSITQNLC